MDEQMEAVSMNSQSAAGSRSAIIEMRYRFEQNHNTEARAEADIQTEQKQSQPELSTVRQKRQIFENVERNCANKLGDEDRQL